ncbi:MAG: TonB-dependent hemoglobin/transferrin/lactoferrin family receptor [Lysobacter sp.]
MRSTQLNAALWIALGVSASAFATTPANPGPGADDGVHELAVITVSATRTERAIEDVANTVDVIDREQMDRELIRDLKDLMRYEPGISVTSGVGRFGIGDIRIRGLGGNRVRIETDGIAVPDSFAIGSFSNANRNFIDLDTLKRVEIVRGPSSSLYGSDALGGVVTFVTKDPADYLAPGKSAHFGIKLGVESDWRGLFGGATAAFGGEQWSGLVAVSHRQGQETENQGRSDTVGAPRTAPNPQSRNGRSLLTKLAYAPSAHQRFKLTVEGNEDAADTDVLNLVGFQPRTRSNTLSLLGEDHQTRARVSLAHEVDAIDAGFADGFSWQIYRQDSETTQRTYEEQINAARAAIRREREFNFDQRVVGAEATLHKNFAIGATQHTLIYGIDLSRTDLRQKRDGRAIDHASGRATNVVPPDVFPVRDFPLSQSTASALFVQDEISLADGALRLVPGLRIDHYQLTPQTDPIFAEDNPGMAPRGITKTTVSPKFGAVWKFASDWSLFGSYARGFRSPPYNDVNLGFTNLQFGYAAIPNPNLRPETSDGLELGLRYAGRAGYFSLAGFHNRYDDFIESGVVVSQPPQSPLLIFQSQNVSEAEIQGVEAKAGVALGEWDDALQGWSLRASAAWQRGEDKTAEAPLVSVDPARATLGVGYERERWGVELVGRFAQRKRRLADETQFAPPGHGVLDLITHWEFAPGTTLNLGVFNLADRKYWDWADVTGVAANSPVLDRYTRPGRTVAVSLTVAW